MITRTLRQDRQKMEQSTPIVRGMNGLLRPPGLFGQASVVRVVSDIRHKITRRFHTSAISAVSVHGNTIISLYIPFIHPSVSCKSPLGEGRREGLRDENTGFPSTCFSPGTEDNYFKVCSPNWKNQKVCLLVVIVKEGKIERGK